tara:strand:- start:7159 stop:7977 length:819 start_codon:yes stop_codon:yes gene_type:complete
MQKTKTNIIKNNSKFYKLDFGIEDIEKPDKIQLLIFLATLSGFSGIDVLAKEEIIKVAIEAIKKAKQKSKELNIELNPIPLLCSSFGIDLISDLDKDSVLEKIEFLTDYAIDVIDIHFNAIDFLTNINKVDLICDLFKNKIISVNLSRKRLSNIHMVDLLKTCFSYSKKNLIIEVEGLRLYDNDYSHILQTVSTADIINKQFIQTSPKYKRVPIILGNCKNRDIEKLALRCNVPFNGISFFYQNIKTFLSDKSTYSNEDIQSFLSKIKLYLS